MNKVKNFSATNLNVRRGDNPVFQNLSFELVAGELLKLVGPNGSGKSTLLKTLCGLVGAERGDVTGDGVSVLGDNSWASENICYLGHKNALKREFTVLQNVAFWAQLWGTENKVENSIKRMGIGYLANTPVRYLSSGQLRRTALARSMCHGANIWLFDEPTVGLDDQGLEYLARAMDNHLAEGGMIICATHVDLGVVDEREKKLNLADFAPSPLMQEGQWQ